MWGGIAQY
jgi:pimeloyl-ACP methyl ester carboxylesterase